MPSTWKVSLNCTRAEADALAGDLTGFAELDAPPVLVTTELDTPHRWRLDAYFEKRPTPRVVKALVAMVPSAAGTEPIVHVGL